MMPRTCIGYGPHTGTCENVAGTQWSEYWCPRCDRLRMDAIEQRMQQIERRLEARQNEPAAP